MSNTLPGDIDSLCRQGAPVRVASPLGSLEWVGSVAATTCDVFAAGANPITRNLADVVLDLDEEAGADIAIRWASAEHGVDLHRVRSDPAMLAEYSLALAGDPGAPAVTFDVLPSMSTAWSDWDPGVAVPAEMDTRKPAHRDLVIRWAAGRLSMPPHPTSPGFYYDESGNFRGWRIESPDFHVYIGAGGLHCPDMPVDANFAAIGACIDETDAARALALLALQIAIVQESGHADVGDWATARDALLADIGS